MRELRQRGVDGLKQQHLARGVGQVVVPADDVADAQVGVIDHRTEVVRRRAVRTDENQVVEFLVLKSDPALEHVVDDGLALPRAAEAQHRWTRIARCRPGVAAGAVVRRVTARSQRGLAFGVQLFGRTEAAECSPAAQHPVGRLAVQVEPLTLVVGALVPIQPQPLHGSDDVVVKFAGGALPVGIVDAQDEVAVVLACGQQCEQRRSRAADVQISGRTRRETGADGHGRTLPRKPWKSTSPSAALCLGLNRTPTSTSLPQGEGVQHGGFEFRSGFGYGAPSRADSSVGRASAF